MNSRLSRVLERQTLTAEQQQAAMTRDQDLIVTAGAGSGKTRTLVARYLSLLAEGFSPRQVAAVTFTEKAARGMRNRIRQSLHELAASGEQEERVFWSDLAGEIDAARIGTIHSLCAELIRSYPAAAGIDPQFEVLDEGIAAMLKNDSIQQALMLAVQDPELTPLFYGISIRDLQLALALILEKRLDFDQRSRLDPDKLLVSALQGALESEEIGGALAALQDMHTRGALAADAGDKLAVQIVELLENWQVVKQRLNLDPRLSLREGCGNGVPQPTKRSPAQWADAAQTLYDMRRKGMNLSSGRKNSQAKEILRELRASYDSYLDPWIGGNASTSKPVTREIEDRAKEVLPLLTRAAEMTLRIYKEQKDNRRALDFDDLEALACRLLDVPVIQERWQGEIDHLLVDEFQDTNPRQRQIILAIAGDRAGRLFFVGDAQQSIYRFRGADVTVFVEMQDRIRRRGGITLSLDTTFRCSQPLLQGLDALLHPVMGDTLDPARPFAVPYLKMKAGKEPSDAGFRPPLVEFNLGVGDAITGRQVAARALAERLVAMKNEGEIADWGDVALLFRASLGFRSYEDALSEAGIPFVTVAGIGFYDRPEVRDLLNITQALSDPWDDAAMAGFLRSPAIGLKDVSLLALRGQDGNPRPFLQALRQYAVLLPEEEHRAAGWALAVLDEFIPVANRLSAAGLLTALVEKLDYRAILMAGGPRLMRNIDKLLEDARTSETMSIGTFLEYLKVSRDAGARTGEAVSEAQGAVQLMTIHKSKGLEFPLVVLADASHAGGNQPHPVLTLPQTGMAVRLEEPPALYRYARMLDDERDDAEALRLLYVACTRVQEKLIISGYVDSKGTVRGNLKTLGVGTETGVSIPLVNIGPALANPGKSNKIIVGEGVPVRTLVHEEETLTGIRWEGDRKETVEQPRAVYLYPPLPLAEAQVGEDLDGEESRVEQRDWRALHANHAPAVVVGKLVHKALQRWCFPGAPGFASLMRAGLIRESVVDPAQQDLVLQAVRDLLLRLQRHDLYQQVENAAFRRHEVPFAIPLQDNKVDTGVLDLLYQQSDGRWRLVDFKTDAIQDADGLRQKADEYRMQMIRYTRACSLLLGSAPEAVICFLDGPGRQISLFRHA